MKLRAQWREELSEQLADHRVDMLAIVLAVVGIISLLAIVSDVVGPAGHAIDVGAGDLLGRGKLLVPLALLVGAVLVLTERADAEDDEDAPRRKGLRFSLGAILLVGAAVGGFHLARGNDATGALEPLSAPAASSARRWARRSGPVSAPRARPSC